MSELQIRAGEIMALEAGEGNRVAEGIDGVTIGGKAVLLAGKTGAPRTALLCFGQQTAAAQNGGWLQARWHEIGDLTVKEFLSYDKVWDINPYEVGAKRPMSRREFAGHSKIVLRLLSICGLISRSVIALSNGETRRILLARALLKKPEVLILDDPAAGLDSVQRERLKDVLAALASRGVAIVMTYRHKDEVPGSTRKKTRRSAVRRDAASPALRNPRPVVAISHLHFAFGRRLLFDDFSWTVLEGERWVLRGENGRGKTTLFSLISGDNPMAYAADITVLGVPRKVGATLDGVRSRIGMVSPEMQAYLGSDALSLVRAALGKKPRLLLLDEPFMNMDAEAVKVAGAMIVDYLTLHPRVAAILICHREDEVPAIFDKVMTI